MGGSERTSVKPPRGGLSSAQAAERLARDGENVLPPGRRVGLWRRIATQLRDPLSLVLVAAVVLTIATGDWTDAAVILLVIVVNTTVGVAQEVKADREIAALAELAAPEARVLRDGVQQKIPAAQVVVGDILVLAEGDIVPADAIVVQAAALLIDEAALTGESVPVDKVAASEEELADVVSAGTVVVRGRGQAVVTATGAASAMGRIATLMVSGAGLTPLQRRLVGVGRFLAVSAVALCAVVLVLGLLRGQPVELMVVTAISLVVAAVPESLPAVVTLALALGARRMVARNVLIRRLPAVETLGSVTVIATDKTGTLTAGTMLARLLWTQQGEATVSGGGYAPVGEVRRGGVRLGPDDAPDVTRLLSAAVLCNDATLRPPERADGSWTALGDPTEAALLAAGAKLGLHQEFLNGQFPRETEIPFDSSRKRMTTVHRLTKDGKPTSEIRVICKGAPEALLHDGVLMDDAQVLARTAARAEEFARDGLRVLALAQADRTSEHGPLPDGLSIAELESGMRLLGLIAIIDPPRPSARSTIDACHQAGITPVLITGDHPETARAVATEVGIIDATHDVVDCRHMPLDKVSALRTGRAFARATPEQKLSIIEARQSAGDVVAMTGDGVNDGPALRRADIGVAMGRRGTEVARQASDLVLADDDLATVVVAAEEGRRVYANIRRFLLYGLSGGSAEIVVMLAGPFLGMPLPLLPAQILWVNLLTHGLPGVALGSEPANPGIMGRPPRPPAESVLGAGLWQRILRIGGVIAAVTLGVAVWGTQTGRPWQSMAFFALGATQLTVAIGARARPGTWANPMLIVAVTSALLLQLAGLYVPILRQLLGTEPLGPVELLAVCAASSLGYLGVKLDRLLNPGPRSGTRS